MMYYKSMPPEGDGLATERVTITLPRDLVEEVDRRERNRSKFIREAIRHELERRRREAIRRSLLTAHAESGDTSGLGIDAWAAGLPEGDDDLLDPEAGTDVEWRPHEGWVRAEP
jgi:Arc/MetJ-type ribon-helix-helix transcriptional regulator